MWSGFRLGDYHGSDDVASMGVSTNVERWRELPASATVAGISDMLGAAR